jgi:hypothetical protein
MRELETNDAGKFARYAAMDAQRRNSNNKSHYSQQQITKALIVRDLLDTAFSTKSLFINYRQKFIAIKAEGARARDAIARDTLKMFEANGYGVVSTPQGLIVRIAKV